MTALVTIGEFSRLAHLSVKALRHYHTVGVLTPATVDRQNGYRLYSADQLADAHIVRRLRQLEMPLDEVKVVLESGDRRLRDRAIAAHLERMELELQRTREVVVSLRELLETPARSLDVEHRSLPAGHCAALRATVSEADIESWCVETLADLSARVASAGLTPSGPNGVQFANEYFELGEGQVVAFLPLGASADVGSLNAEHLPLSSGQHATTEHRGSYRDLDRTYGALGSYVAEHGIGGPGPITELYLVGPDEADTDAALRTEVCWPILVG